MKIRTLIGSLFMILAVCFSGAVSHADDLAFWLDMWDTDLESGDSLVLEICTMNEGEEIPEAAFCLLLEVNGQFWCWPSWQSMDVGFDYQIRTIQEGRIKSWVFNTGWPDVPSAGIDLYFWGAVLDVNLTKLLAPYDKVTWTY